MIKKRGVQNKTVLVTGSEGFIGTNLCPVLKDKGYEFLPWDKKLDLDIFDNGIEEIIKDIDIVIHLAALTSVNLSFNDPSKVFETNVLGTARIAYLCQKYNKKLIYPSSAAIYHLELSPYAESKKLAEDIVRTIKTPVVVLRLFNVFGSNMNPNSGSIMYNFLTSNKLTIYGDGEQTRDYVHVRDVVDIMCEAINPSWNESIVDVGTGQAYSVNYIAGLFAHYRKKKLFYESPRRESKWSIANTKMLKRLYKKPLTTNIEKDIQELCKN